MLVRNNPYHSAAFFHTSNALVGGIYNTRANISQFFSLPFVNEELAKDNARLREELSRSSVPIIVSSKKDSLELTKPEAGYGFLYAKVINNSTQFNHNFITINKGKMHGVEPGMGVVSSEGVVGKVMSVSKNFSTVSSVLNTDVFVSALINRNKTFGSVKWDGRDALTSKLLFVPRHIDLIVGDTIVTSGYNAVFPEKIKIGYINEFAPQDDSFYDIDITLANDFSRLAYVYIVKNPIREERQELEQEFEEVNEQ